MPRAKWVKPYIVTAVFIISVFISSSIRAADTDAAQITQGIATNTSPPKTAGVTSSNITIGNPEFIGMAYDKATSLKPATINGTHGFLVVFTGNGIFNGVNVTDSGKGFITNGPNGVVYFKGEGIWMGRISNIGTATYNFQGRGQYGADGKLRDIITELPTNATGKLAFLGNVIVIHKSEIDKAGDAITRYWELN